MSDLSEEMKMNDKVEILGKGTVIQHGKQNNRIYLMKLDERDASIILERLLKLAHENNYGKIFCKVPKWIVPKFLSEAYLMEASIPSFYNNIEDVFFVSKFLDSDRLLNIDKVPFREMSVLLEEGAKRQKNKRKLNTDYKVRKLKEIDVEQITAIYREVFITYPFPIHSQDYILKTMNENVEYFGVEIEGKLAAIASSEMDLNGLNAEMTDFATSKRYLGNGLAILLLEEMEKEMKIQGMKTLYTIARLKSIPMNKTFLRFDYNYSGTLINNTNIAGNIESMNVFYKHV